MEQEEFKIKRVPVYINLRLGDPPCPLCVEGIYLKNATIHRTSRDEYMQHEHIVEAPDISQSRYSVIDRAKNFLRGIVGKGFTIS